MVLESFEDIILYQNTNSYKRQIKLLQKDLESYTDLLTKYKRQEAINNEQLALVEKDYKRDKSLFEAGVITAREFDAKKNISPQRTEWK